MRRYIAAVVAAGLFGAMTGSAQQVVVRVDSDLKAASGTGPGNWVFGTCEGYDNSLNVQPFLINGRDAEHGDDVTMGGGPATMIMLQIHGNGGDHNADVQVRIFEGGRDPGLPPGEMLWESAAFPQMLISGGTNDYEFPIEPAVNLPREITWTLALLNMTGGVPEDAVGPRVVMPPVVGFTEDFSWEHFADGSWTAWGWVDANGNPVLVGMGARIDISCDECLAPCDMDCDGDINAFDIEPFLALLFENATPCCGERGVGEGFTGDVNLDGVINAFDIEPFLNCLFP